MLPIESFAHIFAFVSTFYLLFELLSTPTYITPSCFKCALLFLQWLRAKLSVIPHYLTVTPLPLNNHLFSSYFVTRLILIKKYFVTLSSTSASFKLLTIVLASFWTISIRIVLYIHIVFVEIALELFISGYLHHSEFFFVPRVHHCALNEGNVNA